MSPTPGERPTRDGRPAGSVRRGDHTRRVPVPVEAKLSRERTLRLLRAKQGQLETQVLVEFHASGMKRLDLIVADLALLFGLLADHLEECDSSSTTG